MNKTKKLAQAILAARQAESDLAVADERLEAMGEDVAQAYKAARDKLGEEIEAYGFSVGGWVWSPTNESIAEKAPKTKQFDVLKYGKQLGLRRKHSNDLNSALATIRELAR